MLFARLRDSGIPYAEIFLITAGLYAMGVAWYYLLIRDHDRRQQSGKLDP